MAKKPHPLKGKRPRCLGKGSSFERTICKTLSKWWSGDSRDDIFWRSSSSGARAKQRSKSGLGTFGQYGDVQATDPIGQPLIDLISIEMKRGYNHASLQDLLDKAPGAALQPLEAFILQAQMDHENARSFSWMLVIQRDRREPLAVFPDDLYIRLVSQTFSHLNEVSPAVILKVPKISMDKPRPVSFAGKLRVVPFNEFLDTVDPEDIRKAGRKPQ